MWPTRKRALEPPFPRLVHPYSWVLTTQINFWRPLMATSVNPARLSVVALAAATLFLSACGGGGGDAPSSSPTTTPAETKAAPFVGTATASNLLSVKTAQPTPAFNLTFNVDGTKDGKASAVRKTALSASTVRADYPDDDLIDWGERTFNTLFPYHAVTQNGDVGGTNYNFRGYNLADGGTNFVGIAKTGSDVGGVYGIGTYTGWNLVRFGHKSDFQCAASPPSCGPTLASAKIVNFAGETLADLLAANPPAVSAKATRLALTYSETLDCAGVGGTGVVGGILITVACEGRTVTFTPGQSGEERWPMGTTNTLTVGGLRNTDGYPSASVDATFTTNPPQVAAGGKVYTANWLGKNPELNMGNALSLYDGATETLNRQIDFGNIPGYQVLSGQVVLDPAAGVVYMAPRAGSVLYRLDLETDAPLASIKLDVTEQPSSDHGMRGMALSDQALCLVLGRSGPETYYRENSLLCFGRHTGREVYRSSNNFVTDATKIPMGLVYASGRKKFYVPNASVAAMYTEPPNDASRARDGWLPGHPGTVTEIDAESFQVTRTFTVGSAPSSPFVDEGAGKLYIFNAGDKTASVVDLETGIVTTPPLGMSGFERPIAALPDWDKGRVYVSDDVGAIRILHPATLSEVGRIDLGQNCTPGNMAIVNGKLWVACYKRDTFFRGDQVLIIDRDTLMVTRSIVTRSASTVPDFQANMPWAITSYVPPTP